MPATPEQGAPAKDAPTAASGISRGVTRLLRDMGYASLCEFRLSSGRRADVAGIDRKGAIFIVEVKSSLSDYQADEKWRNYLAHCDRFAFAVGQDFPVDTLPVETGLIVADCYGAELVRPPPKSPMKPNLRKKEILSFARQAAARLGAMLDPGP